MPRKPRYSVYQQLVFQKLDDQKEDIKDIKVDVRGLRDELVELKTNHVAHLAADVIHLKDDLKELKEQHTSTDRERVRGRWKVWGAFITGLTGIIAACSAYLLGR